MNPKSKTPVTISVEVTLGRIPLGSFSRVGVNLRIGMIAPKCFSLVTIQNALYTLVVNETSDDNAKVLVDNVSLERYEQVLKTLKTYLTAHSAECTFDITGKITQEDWDYLRYYYDVDARRSKLLYYNSNITPRDYVNVLVGIGLRYKENS